MRKLTCAMTVGICLLGSAVAAENPARSGSKGEKGAVEAQSADASKELRGSSLMEMRVTNPQKEELGTISELLIDKNGKVSYLVLQAGGLLGMGEERYMIPWNRVRIEQNGKVAVVNVSKDRLPSEFAAFEPKAKESSGKRSQ